MVALQMVLCCAHFTALAILALMQMGLLQITLATAKAVLHILGFLYDLCVGTTTCCSRMQMFFSGDTSRWTTLVRVTSFVAALEDLVLACCPLLLFTRVLLSTVMYLHARQNA